MSYSVSIVRIYNIESVHNEMNLSVEVFLKALVLCISITNYCWRSPIQSTDSMARTVCVLLFRNSEKWASLAEEFNALVSAVGLNLPEKRVDPGFWLRSGFESLRILSMNYFYPISDNRVLTTATWYYFRQVMSHIDQHVLQLLECFNSFITWTGGLCTV